jgi:hypothetical protein
MVASRKSSPGWMNLRLLSQLSRGRGGHRLGEDQAGHLGQKEGECEQDGETLEVQFLGGF